MANPARVGLVLGAGGIAGQAFHAGVLRALEDGAGWDPRRASLIIGTSAGSIVATALRAGVAATDLHRTARGEPPSAEAEALLGPRRTHSAATKFPLLPHRGLPRPASIALLAQLARSPLRARTGLLLAGLLPEGRLDPTPIARDVTSLLRRADVRPDDLWITAVRLRDGRRIVFGRDEQPNDPAEWGRAVASSCAIPGVFAPVPHHGERLVDGGAHSATNADLLLTADRTLDTVIVSSPMSATRDARRRSIDSPVRTLHRFRLAAEVRALRGRGLDVVVFQPTDETLRVAGLDAMNPEVAAPVAETAYDAAFGRCTTLDLSLPAGLAPPA